MRDSEQIWNKIKDLHIELFGLKNQTVSHYCHFIDVLPTKCFLSYKVSAVLPALETLLMKDYDVELNGNYIVITTKQNKHG